MNKDLKDLSSPPDSHQIRANEDFVDWIKSNHPNRINGVALVIHGLNLRPDKMASIIGLLTHSYIDVLNLSLRGHGKNYVQKTNVDSNKSRMETFKTVSYERWINETHRAFGFAEKRSRKKQVPIFLIGFSLGGLIGAALLASYPDVYFDRMVLFAPALCINKIYYLARLLSPFPKLVIPSLLTKSYCSNRGTPIAGYNALFEAIKHFNKNMTQKLNIPTLIFIDKKDELVSYRRLQRILKIGRLYQWKLHPVIKSSTGYPKKMHHLIVDGSSMGKDAWDGMTGLIIHHLLA